MIKLIFLGLVDVATTAALTGLLFCVAWLVHALAFNQGPAIFHPMHLIWCCAGGAFGEVLNLIRQNHQMHLDIICNTTERG